MYYLIHYDGKYSNEDMSDRIPRILAIFSTKEKGLDYIEKHLAKSPITKDRSTGVLSNVSYWQRYSVEIVEVPIDPV